MQSNLPFIRHASIFDVRGMAEADRAGLGCIVLVMRRWPQGFSWESLGLNLWLPDAGPSPGLLKVYQLGEINWQEFAQRYQGEQTCDQRHAGYYKVGKGKEGRRASTLSPLQHLRELRRLHGLVTVLCHERKGNCHRHILVQLANEETDTGDGQLLPICQTLSTVRKGAV